MPAGIKTVRVCDGETVANDSADHAFPIANSEGPVAVHGYEQITFAVDAAVGAGSESIDFYVDIAVDPNGTWFRTTVHDLTSAGAAKDIQSDAVTVTADLTNALLALRNPAPYARLIVNNSGENSADITVWAIIA